MKRNSLAAAAAALALMPATAAPAAEVTVLCSNALKSVLEELAPRFEQATAHKPVITFGSTDPLKARIEKGDAFDLAILGVAATDDLIKQGKLIAATRVDVARSGIGVAIRRGAPKPDLATTAAFKRALIEAKSIAYSEQGLTGRYLESLFQRLGVAAELKAKTRNGRGAELVGQGEAEIGMTQVSEILPVAGVELAGPLPPELQHYTVFPAAVGTAARQADAARALLTFLATPDAARVMQAKGLQPPARP